MPEPILVVKDLRTEFRTRAGTVQAVSDVSFEVSPGETMALVGESGSGKSVTALSIMRLLDDTGSISNGSITFDGRDLASVSEREMREIRGREIAMIFQDPSTCLDPVFTIEDQLSETLRIHGYAKKQCRGRALELLRMVRMPDPETRLRSYPHQLSGGQRQRAMIAIALALDPKLIIADEPTTALDVTVQAQILDLLRDLQTETGTAIVFVTHDLGVVAEIADRVAVMYAGKIVEQGPVWHVLRSPKNPYTTALLRSMPGAAATANQRLSPIDGVVPSLTEMPTGCRFGPRCAHVWDHCVENDPPLVTVDIQRQSRCWLQVPEIAGDRTADVPATLLPVVP